MRALPLEGRIAIFNAAARRDEPFDPAETDALSEALENMVAKGIRADITFEEFLDFLIYADVEEVREVLFTGTHTVEERRQAGAAFVSAISGLISQGRIAAQEAAERLAVAGQIQASIG